MDKLLTAIEPSRFCYQDSVSKGQPTPCTQEKFEQLLDSPEVASICQRITEINVSSADYIERKSTLKKQLPIIIPHSQSFSNSRRIAADAIPSGLGLLDIDHMDNPKEEFLKRVAPRVAELQIYFAAVTPSGYGLRLIFERRVGEAIEAAMTRIADACGFDEIDSVTKDLARASFMMPRSYVLHYNPKGLFEWPSKEAEDYWTSNPTIEHIEQPTIDETPSEAVQSEDLPLFYKGIPYKDIVEQLMLQIGAQGGAMYGERNTVYFTLANYLRYITDFNPNLLLRILPDFGLSIQERQQTIRSALSRPRKLEIPVVVQSAITMVEQTQLQDNKQTLKSEEPLSLPKLPRLLSLVCRRVPAAYHPAMLIASLPVLGTLATRIRFQYLDKQTHSLSFFACISAPCASGKSFIRQPVNLLLTPINEQDEIERKKEQTYKERLRTSKNSKTQPEDPHACPRNNGISISVAKLLQLMTYAEGKHLIGISEEMDTLIKSEKAGVWSQKSDIYRMAFDNSEYGQSYMSEQSFSAKVPVYYNLLLTGTPRSMSRFFQDDNIENGLATRTCFGIIPDTSYSEMPVFEPYTEKEKTEILEMARALDQETGSIRSFVVEKAIAEWLEDKRQKAIDADSHAADIIRRRAAVIGFRAGMLCYILEQRSNKKSVAEFALWVAEYTFRNQMIMFGDKLEKELTSSLEQCERGEVAALINLLPAEFTTHDLLALRAKKGQSVKPKSISVLLSRWKQSGRIEKIGNGKYRKL